jgi:ketosteroid isomerase-like protein
LTAIPAALDGNATAVGRNEPVPVTCQHRRRPNPEELPNDDGIPGQPCRSPHERSEVTMSDLDDFLNETLARQVKAEEALHNGDPAPRLAMWSTQDPVTVLGAMQSASGWDEVSQLFRRLGSHFSDCTSYRFELVAAGVSGDLAYTVGYEHTSVSWDGVPIEPYTLRVTHAYRREQGEWKIVHRHADRTPINQSSPTAVLAG